MFIVSTLAPAFIGAARAAGRLAAFAAQRLSALARALRHRRAVMDLAALDDRALKDIGLTRSDVHGALGVSILDDPSRVLAGIAGAGHSHAAINPDRRIATPCLIRTMPKEA